MPHVVLITTSYPDTTPGAEAAGSFVEDFALSLSKHVEVTVVAASLRDQRTNSDNLNVWRFAVPRLPLSLLKPWIPTHWPAIVSTLRAGRRALAEAVRHNKPDHILALWVLPGGWWAGELGRQFDIPYSTWALGSDVWSLARIPLIKSKLVAVLRNASARYADGYSLCRDVEKLTGANCTFLPSSRRLPPPRLKPRQTAMPYRLAFLGRWHENKGIDLLMEALSLLGNGDWNKIEEVRIHGGGPLLTETRAAGRRLVGAGRPVVIGDYLDRQGASDLIGWADFLLLPSRIESIPVVFSDAIQLGTRIIATPVGDLPLLHERYCFGLLAREVSAPAFAAAIRSAVRDDSVTSSVRFDAALPDFDVDSTTRRFLHSSRLVSS